MNSASQYFCPRLIDFVIIVGCKEPATPAQLLAKHLEYQQQLQQYYGGGSTNNASTTTTTTSTDISSSMVDLGGTRAHPQLSQLPELLRRYPLDDHKDFMLPQDVTYFCQPEGCNNINCSSQQRADANRDTTSFIFTLTEKDSARVRYGVCINFFRPIEKKPASSGNTGGGNSKSSSLKSKKNPTETDEEDKSSSKHHQHHHHQQTPQRKKRGKKASDVKYTHTLTSLCIISHHPFFSLFRECLYILRRIIEACHARALASSKPSTPSTSSSSQQTATTPTSPNKNNQRGGSTSAVTDTVWGILTGSSGTVSTEQISSLVACEIREIETWILRLLSAPVPVPGKTKLIVSINPKISHFLTS